MEQVVIRPAVPGEAQVLSELAFRSKASWGYDAAFLERCRASLTVDPAQCDGTRLLVAQLDDDAVGWCRIDGMAPQGELTDLWVDPDHMGRGVGRQLIEAAREVARSLGMTSLTLEADPHAVPFYTRVGARSIGETPSTVDPDRRLPLMELEVR